MGYTTDPASVRARDHGPALVCSRCEVAKMPGEFDRSSQRPSGRMGVCKACRTVARKVAYARDPEGQRAAGRARYKGRADAARAKMRTYYEANKTTANRVGREGHLRRKYGLTIDEYDEMETAQAGLCAVCGRHETDIDPRTDRARRLAVDHCHATGVVRGLLCRKCNTAVGLLGESIANVRTLLAYLEVDRG